MQDRKVTLIIEPNGAVEIDVDGVKGPTCTQLTADVEKALGKVTQRTKKVEYGMVGAQQTVKQETKEA